ncbi:hypothetical protein [Cnuella takakiae]|uniref:hypothetical protein n=1 Tax=Cnuella takakiae TaxID=1302690 RepID=UPI0011602E1D|nr:hypothetical protein [Cnuella takakiae]
MLIALFCYRDIRNEKPLLLIPVYSALFFSSNVIDASGLITSLEYRKFFYGLVTFFEYALFSLFFYQTLGSARARRIILLFSALFLAFLSVHISMVRMERIDSIPIGVETLLILFYACYFLFEQLNDQTVLFVYSKYQFWVTIGCMLYLSGSFFVYIFANQIPRTELLKYWFVIDIFLVVKNLCFTLALMLFINQRRKPPVSPFSTFKASY